MAAENGMRIARQYSDEAKFQAVRVSNFLIKKLISIFFKFNYFRLLMNHPSENL